MHGIINPLSGVSLLITQLITYLQSPLNVQVGSSKTASTVSLHVKTAIDTHKVKVYTATQKTAKSKNKKAPAVTHEAYDKLPTPHLGAHPALRRPRTQSSCCRRPAQTKCPSVCLHGVYICMCTCTQMYIYRYIYIYYTYVCMYVCMHA